MLCAVQPPVGCVDHPCVSSNSLPRCLTVHIGSSHDRYRVMLMQAVFTIESINISKLLREDQKRISACVTRWYVKKEPKCSKQTFLFDTFYDQSQDELFPS